MPSDLDCDDGPTAPIERSSHSFNPTSKSFSSFREIVNSIQLLPEKNLKANIHGLDWIKISDSLMNVKSPEECLIQWVFHDHPFINNRPWSKDELDRLSKIVSLVKEIPTDEPNSSHVDALVPHDADSLKDILGKHQWQVIAEKHGSNRAAIACFIQYQRFLNGSHLRT